MVQWVNFIVYRGNIVIKITVTGLPRLFLIKILSNVFHLVHQAHKIFREELRVQEGSLVLRTAGNSVCGIGWWPFLGVYTSFSKELLENPKHKQKTKTNTTSLLKGRKIPLFTLNRFPWPLPSPLCRWSLSIFKIAEMDCTWAQSQHTARHGPAEWPHRQERLAHTNLRVINA